MHGKYISSDGQRTQAVSHYRATEDQQHQSILWQIVRRKYYQIRKFTELNISVSLFLTQFNLQQLYSSLNGNTLLISLNFNHQQCSTDVKPAGGNKWGISVINLNMRRLSFPKVVKSIKKLVINAETNIQRGYTRWKK